MAGHLGLHPGPYTMRQLWYMAEGKMRQEWDHTSQILAMTHNVKCEKKKNMKTADYFNPLIPKHKKAKESGKIRLKDFSVLKSMLPNVGGPDRVGMK